MFRANHTDQSIITFIRLRVFRKIWPFDPSRLHCMPEVTRKHNNKTTYIITAFKYATWLVEIMMQYANYKVHLNTISNGELSDPICDRVNRGLTLVRLIFDCFLCFDCSLSVNWYPVCWLVPCVLAGTLYLRLRLELLHDIQEVVVDLRLVPELELDLVQIGQGVLDL